MYTSKKSNLGVTLIELIVVIITVAILAAAVTPAFSDMIQRLRLESDQSALVQALKEAKRIATSQGTTVTVTLANPVNSNSTITLSANNNVGNKVSTLSKSSTFGTPGVIVFLANGVVTLPPGGSRVRLFVKNEQIDQKRYVDITAAGQVIEQLAGFTP